MIFKDPAILGLACERPSGTIDQPSAAGFAARVCGLSGDAARLNEAIHARSGVATRASVLLDPSATAHPLPSFFERTAGTNDRGPTTAARMRAFERFSAPLAIAAGRRALEESAAPPESVTHVITVSCTGFSAPGLDIELMEALALPSSCERLNLGFMGCHGALIALRVGADIARARGLGARVLIVCVELCSLHFQHSSRPDHIVANALFADGAAAAVVGVSGPSPRAPRITLRGAASTLIPNSRDAMSWRIADHGFEMTLAERVPDLIRSTLAPWLRPFLCDHTIDPADPRVRWALHPGGPKVITAVGDALGLSDAALGPSRAILRTHGNMSSPTVLFILEALTRGGAPGASMPDGPIVMIGFAPGLTVEAAVLDVRSPKATSLCTDRGPSA